MKPGSSSTQCGGVGSAARISTSVISTRLCVGTSLSISRLGLKENDLAPARITDEISNFHAQCVVVPTGYMSYNPAVWALEAAIHCDRFTEI